MHVYRRPFDYSQRSAIVRWQTSPEWTFSINLSALSFAAPPWTIGLSPTVNMDATYLTITAPAWTISSPVLMDLTTLTFTAPAWSVSYTQEVGTVPDVVGLDQTAAVASVRSAGLTPLVVYSVTGAVDPQKVTAQDPAAATVVSLSSAVTITAEAGVYAWPSTVIPQEAEWKWHTRSRPMISPLTGKTRTVSDGGSHWSCTLTVRHLKDADRAQMQAFLSRLRGKLNRATLPAAAFRRNGLAPTNIYIYGAGQTGTTFVCSGAFGETAPLLTEGGDPVLDELGEQIYVSQGIDGSVKAGDMCEIGRHLYMIVADADSDNDGILTIEIVPPIITAPADGTTVNILTPRGRFVAASNSLGWSNAPGGFSSFESIEFIEDRS